MSFDVSVSVSPHSQACAEAVILQLVQNPIKSQYEDCTTPAQADLVVRTMWGVATEFKARGHHPPSDHIAALKQVVATLAAMADGTCPPRVYLSSLDPGVGKTTALIHFIKQLVGSSEHDEVGMLVCLSRIDEIKRLVKEAELDEDDFAILSRDKDANALSDTFHHHARILFTTQQMLQRRCAGATLASRSEFHFQGEPRAVRVWDETLEPGDVVSLSSDDLGGLLTPLRTLNPSLADQVQKLQGDLLRAIPNTTLKVPSLQGQEHIIAGVRGQCGEQDKRRIDILTSLSGRTVRVVSGRGNQRIALDIRDAFPSDLAPLMVLDASGRVRQTYVQWEKRGGLVHLPSPAKDYSPLQVHVLHQGGAKDTWRNKEDQLAKEVAILIDSKPDEPWLVVVHKATSEVNPEQAILGNLQSDKTRVDFLTWGRHQATNAFKDIPNVILAGTLFMPDSQYLGLAYASSGCSLRKGLPVEMVNDIKLGEHGHLVLQALCRASVRGSDGAKCTPCSAYIIASKASGICNALPLWFPGCQVQIWEPQHKPLKGCVKRTVAYLERCCREDPSAAIPFSDVMRVIGVVDKSNFNKTIRKHVQLIAALNRLGIEEIKIDGGRYYNAFRRIWEPDPEASYFVDV